MVAFDITDDVVSDLSTPARASSIYTATGFAYDYAIAGLPFLSATSDERPYLRALASVRKQQIDQTTQPGEQSLEGWWLRSQSSFHSGAGITYMEPSSDARVMRRFADSRGVDVWTPGEVKLLPATTSVSAGRFIAAVNIAGTDRIVSATTTTAAVYNADTGASVNSITGISGTILGVTSAGDRALIWTASNVYVTNTAGTSVTAHYTPGAGSITGVWLAKQRLIVAVGNILNEVTANYGGTAVVTTITTHPNTGWVWTSAVDAPDCIYVSGYAGNSSAIYRVTVSSSGSVTALTAPSVAAEFPVGETVRSMFSYLGTYVVLGTTAGVRVGTLDYYGRLQYGPVTLTTANPVQWMTGEDRFVYVGVTAGIDGAHGLYRIDLSDADDKGFHAYATDLQTGKTTGTLTGLALANGKLWIAVSDDTCYRETTTYVSSGWLQTAKIRYGTAEPKLFKRLRLRASLPGTTTVAVTSIDDQGTEQSLFTYTGAMDTTEVRVSPDTAQYVMAFKFTLTTDGTNTPTVSSYQVRSLPAIQRAELIQLNLICFDFERDKFGVNNGGMGTALDRYLALVNAVRAGDIVRVQDLSNDESVEAIVEDMQFKQQAPPNPTLVVAGFGGVVTITVRTVT